MKMISYTRRRLGLKLFLTYLAVISTTLLVLAVSAKFVIPSTFDRHMGGMMGSNEMMGGMGMMGLENMNTDLYFSFRSAVGDALVQTSLAAFTAALVVSLLVSRRVVTPLQELTQASQYIADGHFDQRVKVPGSAETDSMDELSQLAVTFNQMAEKLDQTETMRRQLIGDVSHELRTPLTTIKGSMEGLLDGVLSPNPETFENIYREASRLERLVTDLQELSRVESGAMPLQTQPTSLPTLIQAILTRLQPQFTEKGVSLHLDAAADLPMVRADEDRIAQVLINLLGNALQYTPESGSVRITARQVSSGVEVCVTDSGIGIPAEHLAHVFTRFYRVDKSRSRAGGGSGIGLTIARLIIEAHGGRIWAESDGLGQGSKFSFVLPLADL